MPEALALVVEVFAKTLDAAKLTPEKMEIATFAREEGKSKIRILPASEVAGYIKTYEAEEAKLAAEKAKQKEKDAKKDKA